MVYFGRPKSKIGRPKPSEIGKMLDKHVFRTACCVVVVSSIVSDAGVLSGRTERSCRLSETLFQDCVRKIRKIRKTSDFHERIALTLNSDLVWKKHEIQNNESQTLSYVPVPKAKWSQIFPRTLILVRKPVQAGHSEKMAARST